MRPRPAALASIMALTLAVALASAMPTPARAQTGAWMWPVSGPILRRFDASASTYGPGHRGIDVAATLGTAISAAASGTVTATGVVSGNRYVSVRVAGDLLITYSYLATVSVRAGAVVTTGQSLGTSGRGHAESGIPGVHVAVRSAGVYVDPYPYFSPLDVRPFIRLA